MKERPILFSAPMVRAILDGSKTQTRRVVKPQPFHDDSYHDGDIEFARFMERGTNDPIYAEFSVGAIGGGGKRDSARFPYGQPGDRLWVRETWGFTARVTTDLHERFMREQDSTHLIYRATSDNEQAAPWYPSIHMPRWASRITLEITGVRVERLNGIHSAEALAEGINNLSDESQVAYGISDIVKAQHPVRAFQLLWEQINGPGSWEANPWVWVVEFRRLPK